MILKSRFWCSLKEWQAKKVPNRTIPTLTKNVQHQLQYSTETFRTDAVIY